MHAFDFFEKSSVVPRHGLWAIYGDDRYLRKQVQLECERRVLGPDREVGVQRFGEPIPQWRDISDGLVTVSLFGPPISLVVVEDADKFVTQNRDALQTWAEKPPGRGLLLLEVTSWSMATKLGKLTAAQDQQIDCSLPKKSAKAKGPDVGRLTKWLQQIAQRDHQYKLSAEAAEYLIHNCPPELGLLEQNVAKLGLYAHDGKTLSRELLNEVIGGWQAKTAFEMLDAALDGRARDALEQLERLLHAGEPPQVIFGAFAFTLRKFAAAMRIIQQQEEAGQRPNLLAAVQQADFGVWQIDGAQRRLKHLGRQRCGELFQRLLQIDLALKGSHSTPNRSRWLFEQLLIDLAQPTPTRRAKA